MKVNFTFNIPWTEEYSLRDGLFTSEAQLLRDAILQQVVYQVDFPLESVYQRVDVLFR